MGFRTVARLSHSFSIYSQWVLGYQLAVVLLTILSSRGERGTKQQLSQHQVSSMLFDCFFNVSPLYNDSENRDIL